MSGLSAYRLSYEISPIILSGGQGLLGLLPGGLMPIVALTEAANFIDGLLGGGPDKGLDDFFAHFEPVPGGSLIDNQAATYTFANQQVAANAMIGNGTRLSMKMICPARGPNGWAVKLATFTALVASLKSHVNGGGSFIVATPAYIYTDGLLLGLRDVTGPRARQPQAEWVWDFYFPLITEAQAASAQNTAMGKITSGVQTNGALSGISPTIGLPPSIATPSLIPSSSALGGALGGGAGAFSGFGF